MKLQLIVLNLLFHLGNIPYPALETYLVLDYIKKNNRLQQPQTCPDEIYELMLDCWQINPMLRPMFDDIVRRIKAIIAKKEQEFDNQSSLSVNYVNFPIEQYYSRNEERISKSTSGYITDPSFCKNQLTNGFTSLKTLNKLNDVIEMPGN